MYQILIFFCLFIIVSFIGWIVEIISIFIETKKIVNRGFLIGPYCPIYGLSTIIMVFLLDCYKNNLLVLLIMSIIICTISEYLVSYLMEKFFKARWWDYSHMPFNINGRICLSNCILFGIGSILLLKWIVPFLISCLYNLPIIPFYYLTFILLILFVTDTILSFHIIFKFKSTIEFVKKDYTGEFNDKVQKIILEKMIPFQRLIKAFPHRIILGIKTFRNK